MSSNIFEDAHARFTHRNGTTRGVESLLEPAPTMPPEWHEFAGHLEEHSKARLVQLSSDAEHKKAAAENIFYALAYYVEDGHQFPATDDPSVRNIDSSAPDLSFRLSKYGYGPTLKFEYTFSRLLPSGQQRHKGALLFPFGRGDYGKIAVQGLTHRWVPGSIPYLELQFDSSYALTQHMLPTEGPFHDEELSSAERSLLAFVKKCKCPDEGSHQLHFRLYPYNKEVEEQAGKRFPSYQLQELQALLPGGQNPCHMLGKDMWLSYLRRKDAIDLPSTPDEMLSRFDIANSTPRMAFVNHTAPTTYKACAEYAVMHGYGHHLDFEEEKTRIAALSANAHRISFYTLDEDTVIGCVKWTSLHGGLKEDDKVQLPHNTTATAYVALGNEAKPVKIFVTSGENILDLDCDVLMYILDKSAKAVRTSAVQYSINSQPARWHSMKLTVVPNERPLKAKLETISEIVDASCAVHAKLWPVLNYDGDSDSVCNVDPFDLIPGGKGEVVRKALLEGPPDMTWTKSQLRAIASFSEPKGGFGCILGNGGSGKSTLMILKALYLVEAEQYVILCAGRDKICHGLLEKIIEYKLRYFPSVKPLLASAKRSCLEAIAKQSDAEGRESAEVASPTLAQLRHVYMRKAAKSEAHRRRYAFTVEGHVLENMSDPVKSSKEYHGADVKLEPNGKTVNAYQQLQALLDEIALFPLDADDVPSTPQPVSEFLSTTRSKLAEGMANSEYWTKAKLSRARKVVDACSLDVIRSAKLLVASHDALNSDEVRHNFALDEGSVVFIEQDEAHQSDEATTLSPHVRLACRNRIVSHCSYGDTLQLGSHASGVNRSKSAGHAPCNEFRDVVDLSMFERRIRAGLLFVELSSQSRMHPLLFEPAMYRFYPQAEPSGPEVELTAELKAMMAAINGFLNPTPVQERFNWIAVKGSTITPDGSGFSRVNYKHVIFVVDMLDKHVIPVLQGRTHELVLVQAAYAQQVTEYEVKLEQLRRRNGWPKSYIPQIKTTDSCVGQESFMLIGDVMIPVYDGQQWGFMGSRKIGGSSKKPAKKKTVKKDPLGGTMNENAFIYYHDFLERKGCKIVVDEFSFDTLDQPTHLWEDEEVAAVKRLIEERPKEFPSWSRYIELNAAQKEAVREMMAKIAARNSRLERSWWR